MADVIWSRFGLIDRRRLMLSAGASLIAWPALAQKTEQAGAVNALTGAAFAEAGSERRALNSTAPVFIGDKIATEKDSRLAMLLGTDTTLRLGERTSVTIDRFLVNAGGEIVLDSGRLLFDRPSTGPTVNIRSPYGLIAVRGTKFFAGMLEGKFGVFVERGKVDVTAARRTVLLGSGEGTDIARHGAPPTAPKVWGAPRIKLALDSVS
jgi:ferric-dicitrate binding protein FerR (iron transport regulator)